MPHEEFRAALEAGDVHGETKDRWGLRVSVSGQDLGWVWRPTVEEALKAADELAGTKISLIGGSDEFKEPALKSGRIWDDPRRRFPRRA